MIYASTGCSAGIYTVTLFRLRSDKWHDRSGATGALKHCCSSVRLTFKILLHIRTKLLQFCISFQSEPKSFYY